MSKACERVRNPNRSDNWRFDIAMLIPSSENEDCHEDRGPNQLDPCDCCRRQPRGRGPGGGRIPWGGGGGGSSPSTSLPKACPHRFQQALPESSHSLLPVFDFRNAATTALQKAHCLPPEQLVRNRTGSEQVHILSKDVSRIALRFSCDPSITEISLSIHVQHEGFLRSLITWVFHTSEHPDIAKPCTHKSQTSNPKSPTINPNPKQHTLNHINPQITNLEVTTRTQTTAKSPLPAGLDCRISGRTSFPRTESLRACLRSESLV